MQNIKTLLNRLRLWLGSLFLSLLLMSGLAFLIGWATFVEREFGTPVAKYLIYSAHWFYGLIGLLALNVFFAMLNRFPWKKSMMPFLIAHVGILVLIVGCWQTFRYGLEARMVIMEGETKNSVSIPSQWGFRIRSESILSSQTQEKTGALQEHSEEFEIPFCQGPLSWPLFFKSLRNDCFAAKESQLPENNLAQKFVKKVTQLHHYGVGLLIALNDIDLEKDYAKNFCVENEIEPTENGDNEKISDAGNDIISLSSRNDQNIDNIKIEKTLENHNFPFSTFEVLDYWTGADYQQVPSLKLVMEWENSDSRSLNDEGKASQDLGQRAEEESFHGEKMTTMEPLKETSQSVENSYVQELVLDFPKEIARELSVDISRKSVRKTLENGTRVYFILTESNQERDALLTSLPTMNNVTQNVTSSPIDQIDSGQEANTQTVTESGINEKDATAYEDSERDDVHQSDQAVANKEAMNLSETQITTLERMLEEIKSSNTMAHLVLRINNESFSLDLASLLTMKHDNRLADALPKETNFQIVDLQLLPTIFAEDDSIQGLSLRMTLMSKSGERKEMQLLSEQTGRSTYLPEWGIYGALWIDASPLLEKTMFGLRWNPALSSPRLELLQSPDGQLAYRYWDGKKCVTTGSVPFLKCGNVYGISYIGTTSDKLFVSVDSSSESHETSSSSVILPTSQNHRDLKSIQVFQYQPQHELGYKLVPLSFEKSMMNQTNALVKLHVAAENFDETFWLKAIPSDSLTPEQEQIFSKEVFFDQRRIHISLTNKQLVFSNGICLNRYEPVYEAGSSTPASFSSHVQIIDNVKNTTTKNSTSLANNPITISMNRPAKYSAEANGKSYHFRVYQDSFRGPFYPGNSNYETAIGSEMLSSEPVPRDYVYQTVLSLNHDPGRPTKYSGSLLIIFGIAALFFRRKKRQKSDVKKNTNTIEQKKPSGDKIFSMFLLILGALLLYSFSSSFTYALENVKKQEVEKNSALSNWDSWKLIPVYDQGRVMPLNTFAIQVVKDICGSSSPTVFLDEAVYRQLQNGSLSELPPFEDFIKNEEISESKREKLLAWYNHVASKTKQQQILVAERLKGMFGLQELGPAHPEQNNSSFYFSRTYHASEILFSWLIEPEVWHYICFIDDNNNEIASSFDKTLLRGSFCEALSPYQLESSETYLQEIDQILSQSKRRFSSVNEAKIAGAKDRFFADIERKYALFRSLTYLPAKTPSPLISFYLDKILFSAETPMIQDHAANQASLLDQLEHSVAKIQILLLQKENRQHTENNPFSSSDFLLMKALPASSSSDRQTETGMLLKRQLEIVAKIYSRNSYPQNSTLFERMFSDILSANEEIKSHRDEIFRKKIFTEEYRRELNLLSHIFSQIVANVELAYLSLTETGTYTLKKVSDDDRIIEHVDTHGDRSWTASPGAVLTLAENGPMKIVPCLKNVSAQNDASIRNPWLSFQTMMFASPEMFQRFVNPHCDLEIYDQPSELKKINNDNNDSNQETSPASSMPFSTSEALELALNVSIEKQFKPQQIVIQELQTVIQAYQLCDAARQNDLFAVENEMIKMKSGKPETQGISKDVKSYEREFFATLQQFTQMVKKISTFDESGVEKKLRAELFYYRLDPFYWMWLFGLCALISLGLSFLLSGIRKTYAIFTRHNKENDCSTRTSIINRGFYSLGVAFLALSCGTTFLGGCVRAYITGWAPVTNMFETVVLLVFFISLFTLVYVLYPLLPRRRRNEFCEKEKLQTELKSAFHVRNRDIFLVAGTLLTFLVGLLAYYNTSEFNPNIRPLVAVLRSNFWLTIHVFAIMISYAVGAIAWFLALATLSVYLFGRYPHTVLPNSSEIPQTASLKKLVAYRSKRNQKKNQTVKNHVLSSQLSTSQENDRETPNSAPAKQIVRDPEFCCRMTPIIMSLMRLSVFFLTFGIILGAFWADFSWGRFWSWDPKEVWALVTLLIYLVVLHGYKTNCYKNFGISAGAMLGAFAMIMTWYGLSFVMGGGGRHAYAAGESGKTVVLYALLLVNLGWLLAAMFRYLWKKRAYGRRSFFSKE